MIMWCYTFVVSNAHVSRILHFPKKSPKKKKNLFATNRKNFMTPIIKVSFYYYCWLCRWLPFLLVVFCHVAKYLKAQCLEIKIANKSTTAHTLSGFLK